MTQEHAGKIHKDECQNCHGKGQTFDTATRVARRDGKLTTTQLGSGCVRCHGTGRLQ